MGESERFTKYSEGSPRTLVVGVCQQTYSIVYTRMVAFNNAIVAFWSENIVYALRGV